MIDALQLRQYIIRPTLQYLGTRIPYSRAAEDLLMGTCAQESAMGLYIHQLDGGPAQGIFQMEPASEQDIWDNFLKYKPELEELINRMLGHHSPSGDLVGNLYYATAMARCQYFRYPEALPSDIQGAAELWKLRYNTPEGAGTVEEFIANYARHVA